MIKKLQQFIKVDDYFFEILINPSVESLWRAAVQGGLLVSVRHSD
jgi:hypothetical protein